MDQYDVAKVEMPEEMVVRRVSWVGWTEQTLQLPELRTQVETSLIVQCLRHNGGVCAVPARIASLVRPTRRNGNPEPTERDGQCARPTFALTNEIVRAGESNDVGGQRCCRLVDAGRWRFPLVVPANYSARQKPRSILVPKNQLLILTPLRPSFALVEL